MARTGKIARLPLAVREQLNMRLLDGEDGRVLLEWLNSLPVTKTVLDRHFKGEPISDQNLSIWRGGGFAEWMEEQEHIEKVKRLSEYSLKLAKAAGGNLSKGLLAANVGRIQEALEEFWEGLREIESTEDGNDKDKAVTKLLQALTAIRSVEIEEQKLDLKRIEVDQKGEALKLETKKFQRTTCELFIKWAADEQAKNIATSDLATDGKIEALGRHLFGDAW
jgi:hypothetical protein